MDDISDHNINFIQQEDGIRDVAVTGFRTYVLFFQAEDGIRDVAVTGVQTCALPIWRGAASTPKAPSGGRRRSTSPATAAGLPMDWCSFQRHPPTSAPVPWHPTTSRPL